MEYETEVWCQAAAQRRATYAQWPHEDVRDSSSIAASAERAAAAAGGEAEGALTLTSVWYARGAGVAGLMSSWCPLHFGSSTRLSLLHALCFAQSLALPRGDLTPAPALASALPLAPPPAVGAQLRPRLRLALPLEPRRCNGRSCMGLLDPSADNYGEDITAASIGRLDPVPEVIMWSRQVAIAWSVARPFWKSRGIA